MGEDISKIIEKMNDMIQNNQIPDDVKNMLNQFSSNTSSGESNPESDFDINTLLKMKSIMEKVNQNQSDPRSELLKSLKPYLRDSRKSKVDEYIKLFRMEKIFEMIYPLGGEKKNDL